MSLASGNRIDWTAPPYLRDFDSWESMLSFLDRENVSAGMNASAGPSRNARWDLGCDLHKARALAGTGWAEGRAMFVSGMADALAMRDTEAPSHSWERDVAGSTPSVGAYLAGNPRAMWRRVEAPRTKRVLSIVVNITASAGIDARIYVNRGIAIASWIDAAESRGIRIELVLTYPVARSYGNGEGGADMRIALKRPEDALDVDRVAFALAHPAMLRRIGFAIVERDRELADRYGQVYGYPTGYANLPNDVVYFDALGLGEEYRFGTLAGACKDVSARCERALAGLDQNETEGGAV